MTAAWTPTYPTGSTQPHCTIFAGATAGAGRGHIAPSAQAILLDAGAAISPKDEDYRSTPLAWAARNGLPDMVAFLLERGAATNLPDDEPWATPLAWATRRGHHEIVDLLRGRRDPMSRARMPHREPSIGR